MKIRIRDGDVVVVISGEHANKIGFFHRAKKGMRIGFVSFEKSIGSSLVDVFNGDCAILHTSILRIASKTEKMKFNKLKEDFKIKRNANCKKCSGSGCGDGTKICYMCNGIGVVKK